MRFGDQSTGRGTFGGEFGARHCTLRRSVRQRRDVALFPNDFRQTCYYYKPGLECGLYWLGAMPERTRVLAGSVTKSIDSREQRVTMLVTAFSAAAAAAAEAAIGRQVGARCRRTIAEDRGALAQTLYRRRGKHLVSAAVLFRPCSSTDFIYGVHCRTTSASVSRRPNVQTRRNSRLFSAKKDWLPSSELSLITRYEIFTLTWLRYVKFESLLSQIRLSSVTFVRRSQGVETFGNISSPVCTLVILWPSRKILRRSFQGNPSVAGVKHKRGSEWERCRVRVSHLMVSFFVINDYRPNTVVVRLQVLGTRGGGTMQLCRSRAQLPTSGPSAKSGYPFAKLLDRMFT